jgi:phage tail sheath protein FI
MTFDNVYRTDGMVSDAMEQAALPYVDKGITGALIDIISTEGNNFLKDLIQEGALLPGSSIVYNAADNTAPNLAAGIIAFRRIYMVTTPAENIIFYDVLNINLFNNL